MTCGKEVSIWLFVILIEACTIVALECDGDGGTNTLTHSYIGSARLHSDANNLTQLTIFITTKLEEIVNCNGSRDVRSINVDQHNPGQWVQVTYELWVNESLTQAARAQLLSTINTELRNEVASREGAVGLTAEEQITMNTVMGTIAGVTGLISVGCMVYGILKRFKKMTTKLVNGGEGGGGKDDGGMLGMFGGGGDDGKGAGGIPKISLKLPPLVIKPLPPLAPIVVKPITLGSAPAPSTVPPLISLPEPATATTAASQGYYPHMIYPDDTVFQYNTC